MKKWQVWLIWFFLLDEMISLFNELAKATGMIIELHTPNSVGVSLFFAVASIMAFTIYTMKMGTTTLYEIHIDRKRVDIDTNKQQEGAK